MFASPSKSSRKSTTRRRFPIRLSVLLTICAIAVALATGGVLAQKSRKISGGSTRKISGNNKTTSSRNGNTKSLNGTTSGSNSQDPVTGVTVGVPWVGERGIQRTTAEIMQAQLVAPPSTRPKKPEHEIEIRKDRPQDPNAKQAASWPELDSNAQAKGNAVVDAANPQGPRAPQPVSTNFDTVTGPTETGAFPPDTMGAVGPSQFFLFLNGRLRTFSKAGAADGIINADPDVFFASVMTPPPAPLAINFTSDPQVRYDRLSGRWILIIIDVPSANDIGDTPNRILIAVSDAASAGVITMGTVWTYYFVQQNTVGGGDSGEFLDYPSLGVDANALYIGGDMFDAAAGGFNNTSGFVVRKSSILSGGPVVTTAFRNFIGADGLLEPRGVDNYDPAATEGYFIGVSAAAFSRLNMRRIATPGGTPTISADIPFNTPLTTTSAISVDHLGNTGGTAGRLDGIDDRLYAAHIRNGRLWTAHSFTTLNTGVASTSATNRRMSVRWYELIVPPTVGTPTFNQSGTVFDSVNVTQATARQYWFPSVMVSGQGHAALGYSTAGTPFRVDTATNGRLVGDTLGTTGAVSIYSASSTAYNPPGDPGGPRRWGDYSFTSLDPLDDMTMWTVQEYCNGANTYGARVAKLLAPPPATPTTAAPATVPQNAPSTNVVITGTAVAGSGFYDPGPNLALPALPFTHISATVSGGVTVNTVTYTDPTHVTLNISTVGASAGAQTVTITNPDGQSVAGPGILTVDPLPPTSLFVIRVGDGAAALSNASTAAFLEERALDGSLVRTINLPTAPAGPNAALTMAGNSTAEGHLNRSYDGRYLTMTGYDAAPGVAAIAGTTSAATNRIVGRVDVAGTVNTTTRISDAYSAQNIRSAVSDDGTRFWTTGSGTGIRLVALASAGTTTSISTTVVNTRVINIQPGFGAFPTPQLYTTSASGTFQGVSTVGSGLPTTTQTTVILPGMPTAAGPSPYAYVFFDLTGVPGVDTVYVADDRATPNGGVQKWSWDGTTWTLTYTLNSGLTAGCRGLTGAKDTSGNPVLWATTADALSKIVRVTDVGVASPFATIATAGTNTAYRGIAITPTATGGPTAAHGSVNGRITSAVGSPVAGAMVHLSGARTRVTITDANGYYHFNNLETNGFYSVTPELANFHFSPANRSFSLVTDNIEAVFTASADSAVTANAIDTAEYFVRQHYLDFLGREPEAAGLSYWSDQINQCQGNADCIRTRRLDISAAFFRSQEFQDTGSFVYRLYEGALGRHLSYGEFSADRAQVIGGPNLEASKAAFADAFVQRAEFAQRYQASTTADAFVDALLQTMNDAAGVNLSSERAALINRYHEGGSMNASRALVVRQLVDNETFASAVYNESFVTMEYFGYLRRSTDVDGYNFWLNVLNNSDRNNYRGMVCSFVTSAEYQRRFGSVVTRNNSECSR